MFLLEIAAISKRPGWKTLKYQHCEMCYFKVPLRQNLSSKFDCLLIKALFSYTNELLQGKIVIYIVVEPNVAIIEELKHNVASQDDIFRKVKFNWANQRTEEFIEEKEPEHYDFIHFVMLKKKRKY